MNDRLTDGHRAKDQSEYSQLKLRSLAREMIIPFLHFTNKAEREKE